MERGGQGQFGHIRVQIDSGHRELQSHGVLGEEVGEHGHRLLGPHRVEELKSGLDTDGRQVAARADADLANGVLEAVAVLAPAVTGYSKRERAQCDGGRELGFGQVSLDRELGQGLSPHRPVPREVEGVHSRGEHLDPGHGQ